MPRKAKEETVTLTEQDKIRAAVNLPAGTFALGDRTFDIKDLPYDDYIAFVGYIAPLIDTLINRVAVKNTLGIPGIDLDPTQLNTLSVLTMCKDTLPKMVTLMCRQTDPNITEEEVKNLAKRPTVLANAVMLQMAQNGIIKDFTDFFGQMVKTLMASRMTA
jgi:hypothetical protein